ncbi:FHA domain-containing protein [Agromyces ramosus]|uniref:FHA domain-containing protein n=1 Tax=Agromyces ramosus TaxID=33879 RepID=A0A4Q7MC48_9MICO|nr:RDD family protein [Agromyces ramosus]RZS64282.1 FHA domain-containing protein [Agromyces ramosus]
MSVTLDVDDEPTPGVDADGRPDPAYAAALGLVPAPAGRRSAAFALDAAVWVALALPGIIGAVLLLTAVGGGRDAIGIAASGASALPLVLIAVSQVLLAAFGLTQLVLHGRTGRTLGKAAFGIRSVGVAGFGPAGFWRITLRALVLWGAQVVLPFIGPALLFASSGWDPEHRGRSWLDRIGGCYALDVRVGLDPFDARALRHARREAARPPAAATRALPSLASDRAPDEHTFIPASRSSSAVVASGLGEWQPPALAAPGAAPAPSTAAPASSDAATLNRGTSSPPATAGAFVLRFDDGTAVAAAPRGLLGRAPADVAARPPAEATGRPPAVLVPLDDDSMRISKTHAEFGVTDGRFWVADRASKNGTVVELPGGAERSLGAGERIELPVGSAVRLGGRRFTVERSTQA